MTAGVDGQQYWAVNYGPSYVCALKGSIVKLSCVLNYPHDHERKTAFWTKTAVTDGDPPNLCLDPENRGAQCDSEYKDTYSLTLTDVTEADKHIYYCRFSTNRGTWTAIPGAQLDVTDLQVETQQSVKERDSVTLRCKSSCSLPQQTTFIWYRNTQRVTPGIISENQLQLRSVSRHDSGNYQCAVSGYQHLISPPVNLKVGWDVGQQDWGVSYSPSYICALKGSTVKLSCTVKYPHNHQLTSVFWTKPAVAVTETPDLCSDPVNRGRVQCVREYKDTCSITLTDVTEADKHIYYCRFTTDTEGGKWTGSPGAQLDVTDLQVETQQSVKERDSVTLRCKSSCSLPQQTTFIWYRNAQRVTPGIISENQLQLRSVSRHDSGNYQCAVSGYQHLISPPVYLNVEYPPQSVSVSISASGEIVEGDSVTLSCSSDSNPPALIFSWFKEDQTSAVGSGQSFIISSFNSSHSGRYYCEAQNQHGSQRSASVSVSVKGAQRAALHTVTGIVTGCGGLIFIIIVFIKKKRRDGGAKVVRQNQQDDRVGRSAETASTNDVPVYSLVSANQGDDLYANIKAKKPKRSGRKQTEKDSGDVEDIQYASVHQFKKKDMNKTEETIEMQHPSDANRSEDVIYSSVK
ncbi:B-cell receptor CD22-like [Onychostoma macrolepis]|nr:B-cell receptor CD22-like [Onychostoma macrolepis]